MTDKISFIANCCLPNQLIITDRTVKPIAHINIGERVYGNSFDTVIQTFQRSYIGQIIEIKGMGLLPFSVTPEHPISVAKGAWCSNNGRMRFKIHGTNFVEAKALKPTELKSYYQPSGWKTELLVFSKLKQVTPIHKISLLPYYRINRRFKNRSKSAEHLEYLYRSKAFTESVPINEDTAELFGYYLAEGSTGNTNCELTFGPNEISLANRTKQIIRKYFPYKVLIRDNKGQSSLTVTFGGPPFSRFLRESFGSCATEKRIPYWILYNESSILQAFLQGYYKGDGNLKRKKGRVTEYQNFTTSSKALALQLQLAFSKLGKFALITEDKREGYFLFQDRMVYIQDRWQVRVAIHVRHKFFKEDNDNFYIPIQKISLKPYSGSVFNLHTNSNVFAISNVLSHNCGGGPFGIDPAIHCTSDFFRGPNTHMRSESTWLLAVGLNMAKHGHPTTIVNAWGDLLKYPPPENVKVQTSSAEPSGICDVVISAGFDETDRHISKNRNVVYRKSICCIGGGPRPETMPYLFAENSHLGENHYVARPNRCYEEEWSKIPHNRAVYCPHPVCALPHKPNTNSKMMLWANRGAWASDSYAPYSEKVLSFMEANPEYHYHVLLFSDIRKYASKSIVDRFEALPNKTLDEPYYGVFHDEFLELMSKSKIFLSNGCPACNPAVLEAACYGAIPLTWYEGPYKKEADRFGFYGTDGIRHILRSDALFKEYHAALAEASYDYTEDGAYTIFMNELKRIGLDVE